MKNIFLIFTIFFLLCTNSFARSERSYQKEWCPILNGKIEVVMPDRTRCDCLTEDYAIEFDFGKKWYEAIGQSLHYAVLTGKKPGIALIVEKEKDLKRWESLKRVIEYFKLDIKTWKIEPNK